MSTWKRFLLFFLLASGSGLLVYTSMAPRSWWWAGILGIAIFIQGLSTVHRWWGILLFTWLAGFVYYLFLVPWVGEFVGTTAWLALAFVQSLYFIFLGVLLALIRAGYSRLFRVHTPTLKFLTLCATLGAFALTEYIRARWPFGGFAWGRLSWGQIDGPLAGWAPFTGSAMLSVVLILVALCLVMLRTDYKKLAAGILTFICLGGAGLSLQQHHSYTANQSTPSIDAHINIAAIQGNVPRMGLDFADQRRAVLNNHIQQTEKLLSEIRAGETPQPDIVVWPENASDVDPFTNPDVDKKLTDLATQLNAPLIVGTVTRDASGPRNAVIVWEPDVGSTQWHIKKYLQPFGEWMPMRDFLSRFNEYVDMAGNFVPGDGEGVLRTPIASLDRTLTLGIATCYEVIFDQTYWSALDAGAEILLVPTNNATFGFTDMTYQQLSMSRMRALEYHRSVVVAATSGVSALVVPTGEVIQESEIFTAATLQDTLPLHTDLTFAAHYAKSIEILFIALSMLLFTGICFIQFLRKYTREQSQ